MKYPKVNRNANKWPTIWAWEGKEKSENQQSEYPHPPISEEKIIHN